TPHVSTPTEAISPARKMHSRTFAKSASRFHRRVPSNVIGPFGNRKTSSSRRCPPSSQPTTPRPLSAPMSMAKRLVINVDEQGARSMDSANEYALDVGSAAGTGNEDGGPFAKPGQAFGKSSNNTLAADQDDASCRDERDEALLA